MNGERYSTVVRIMRNLSLSNLYDEKDADGNTPLHHLPNSWIGYKKLVFHSRVDKLALNKKDQTALDVAYTAVEDSARPLRNQVNNNNNKRSTTLATFIF